jgi:GntR family transcriptional regulator
MFINAGARGLLLEGERQKFLREDWPRIHATIQRLGLNAEDLLTGASRRPSSDAARAKAAEAKSPERKR